MNDIARPGPLAPAGRGTPDVIPDARLTSMGPGGGYANIPAPGGDDNGALSFLTELRRMFIKRRALILSITLATIGLGLVKTLLELPLYASAARLQIERNTVKVVEGGSTMPLETNDNEFMRTQYELLGSRAIIESAVASLQLGQDETFLKSRSRGLLSAIKAAIFDKTAGASAIDPARVAVQIVMDNRVIKPVPGSRMVDLSYKDPDPGRAQSIAAALADAFITYNVDRRYQANAFARSFLENQIAQIKIKLEAAEQAAIKFAEQEKIVVVTERASVAETNLASAYASLSSLTQERIKSEELWRQVEATEGINLPQFLSNQAIEGLRTKRSGLTTEYQQKLEIFKPGYPAMVQISNQIADIDRQLATEVKAIRASLKGAYEAALKQEQVTRARVDELKAELLDLQKRSVQYNLLKREVDTTRVLYDGLLHRFKEVDVAGGVGAQNVFIVDRPEHPAKPVSPILAQALLLATVIGLALAIGTAYTIEFLDDAVRSGAAVEQITGLPVLGLIPQPGPKSSVEAELSDSSSPISEAYRTLATTLQLSTDQGLPKALLVTSSSPAEGKSTTAVALARHYTMVGMKVLLVDADLRNPSLHKKLGTTNAVGLSNYLTGACTPPEAMQKTSMPGLAFMASGPLPPNAADLLGSPRLLSLITVGQEIFDCIIVDGPPVMGLADAQLLANVTTATALVVSADETSASVLRGALKRLQMARSNIIGTVLTKYNARSAGFEYGYGYGSGYGYGYGYGGGQREAIENRFVGLGAPKPERENV